MQPLEDSSKEQPNRPDIGSTDSCRQLDEAALLITCLRELPLDYPAGTELPFDIPVDIDWRGLLGLARENGVLLLFYRQLAAAGMRMPGFFHAAAQEDRTAAEALAAALQTLLDSFAEKNIEVLPIKGPSMAQALYADASVRMSYDLDLLVHRGDLPRAASLLSELGFRPLAVSSEYDCKFLRADLLVELHFELASPRYFPFDTAAVWNRSHLVGFRDRSVRALWPIDLVLYLCTHGFKHGFSRLIWILDLSRAMQGWQVGEYRRLLQHARQHGLEPWLLIGCEVVRTMFPPQLPPALDAVITTRPEALERARRVADKLFVEDSIGISNDYRARFLQVESNLIKRWLYRLRYLAPTDTDCLYARSHGFHPALAIVFRPFRLLKKYGLRNVLKAAFPPRA